VEQERNLTPTRNHYGSESRIVSDPSDTQDALECVIANDSGPPHNLTKDSTESALPSRANNRSRDTDKPPEQRRFANSMSKGLKVPL
jgi:hypothetical protein